MRTENTLKFRDIREFLDFLGEKGELRRIKVPVSTDLEIAEIADRAVKSGGPALLFENVIPRNPESQKMPLAINMFGTHQRMAWALGVDDVSQVTKRVRDMLKMVQDPASLLRNKIHSLGQIASFAKTQPKRVKKAPCQDIVITGDDVDLDILPTLKCWPLDAGPFITLPLVITRDPNTGTRNVGTYRMQVYDRQTTGMHWQTHKVGTHHYRESKEKQHPRMDVAVALGADPTTIWAGSLPLPPFMDEIAVSGLVREQAVEMVKCKTVDLEVPAHSEIVLEGYVTPDEFRKEGPFGDHTGYYSPASDYPVFHVTAITHRKDPIYTTTVVGRPPSEDFFMGKASERILLPALQLTIPEVQDINMPAEGVFHNLVIVSIKKEYPGHARKVMYALWGIGLLMLAKSIIVVDANVNVHDLSEVAWRVTANIDPARDLVLVDGPVDDLDHASATPKYGSKVGVDATSKSAIEGRSREWPADIAMTDNIKRLVDSRWEEYGI